MGSATWISNNYALLNAWSRSEHTQGTRTSKWRIILNHTSLGLTWQRWGEEHGVIRAHPGCRIVWSQYDRYRSLVSLDILHTLSVASVKFSTWIYNFSNFIFPYSSSLFSPLWILFTFEATLFYMRSGQRTECGISVDRCLLTSGTVLLQRLATF